MEKEMSFIDHLEELRWHVVRAVIAIMVFTVLAFVNKHFVFHDLILGPSRIDFWTYKVLCQLGQVMYSDVFCIDQLPFEIQSRTMTGQFTMHLSTSFVVGFICAFPYVFWEIWRFISPGLHHTERSFSRGAVFFVTVLFMSGVLFGYYLVSPVSIYFLANYQVDPEIINQFDITSYVGTLTMLVLSSGLMFQLPMVIYFLTKADLVTPDMLIKYRRHAIVVILIVAAIITPPDVMSQILIGLPLIMLYQLSIFISSFVVRKRKRAARKAGENV